jgi:DNA-binding transcriptional MerR regulator
MINYSIKDLEKISGIKAHTIRIWEKRYELLKPHRTNTNIRYYDNAQFKKILNIATLLDNGMKISKISQLSIEEFNKQVENAVALANPQGASEEAMVNGLIVAMIEIDQVGFEAIFSESIRAFGFEKAFEKVVYPFLRKVGLMWGVSEIYPAQEHFISNIIRQKIFTAIDALDAPDPKSEKWVLFLPEEEEHEIGLLLCAYLIRKAGKRVIYLGQSVPFEDLMQITDLTHPECLVTFFIRSQPESDVIKYISKLDANFQSAIIVAGNALPSNKNDIPGRMRVVSDIGSFKALI